MKSIFENKYNPFNKGDKKGEEVKTMTEQIDENEQINAQDSEITENEDDIQQNGNESVEQKPTELEELQTKYMELNNQYIRLAADFDNYRKRQAQEREALISFGAQECLKKVIEVADNFDRALDMVEKIDNLDKMKETFHVLHKQLTESLTKLGLERINCVGEKFDPTLHEAIMQTPTDEYSEDTIINEMQKGYKLGEKVLRPAMVSVAVKKEDENTSD